MALLTGEATEAIMTHYSRSPPPSHKSTRRMSHDSNGSLATTSIPPNTMEARPSRGRSHQRRESKVEFVTAWLDQQDTRPSGDEDHALNDPWLAMSEEEEIFSINIDNLPHGSDPYSNEPVYGGHKRSVSLMHPDYSTSLQAHNVSQEEQELQWYRERYQMRHPHDDQYYQKRYSIHHSHPYHRQTIEQLAEFHSHPYGPIGQVHGWEPLGLASQKHRSAYELAWERHMFYQEQHYQEEVEAERRKIEERQQQELYQQYQQEHYKVQQQMEHQKEQEQQNRHPRQLSLQLDSSDTVARTGSLNRLRSTSLSKDTARVLGLCRSTTLSFGSKKACKSKSKCKRVTSPRPVPARVAHTLSSIEDDANSSNKSRRHVKSHVSNGFELSSHNHYDTVSSVASYFSPRPANAHSGCSTPAFETRSITPVQLRDNHQPSVSAPSTLSRKKTLKDLAPALRSLARACSTRFSRPNSMDVSSNLAQGERPGRLSTQSDHMNDFRPLSMGPDSLAEYQQQQQQQQRRNSLASSYTLTTAAPVPVVSTTVVFLPITFSSKSPVTTTTRATKERPVVYRKVTPFRSNTPSSSSSSSASRPKLVSSVSLPQHLECSDTRPRNSMRFANGRGLDYYFFDTDGANNDNDDEPINCPEVVIVTIEATLSDDTELVTKVNSNDDEDELAVPAEVIHAIGDGDDDDNRVPSSAQKALRREIVALLAKGVRPLSAAAAATVTEVPPPSSSSPPVPAPCLSPLAVEAQEELPPPPPSPTTSVSGSGVYLLTEADLCDRIAFMLVPRYKYRYQPLIAQ
ncbi:hypothetical protein CPB97_011946 [Podila verticillata]|nr:hypothetical protein CPB97_011946 [Podila verticillata]